jgi:hypothetical protein
LKHSKKAGITLPLETLMKIVLILAILIPSATWAADKFLRLTDQAKNDFNNLVQKSNEINKEGIKSIDSIFLTLDKNTAIVFFKENDKGVSYITGFYSGEEPLYSTVTTLAKTIMKPDIEGNILCLCREFISIKDEKGKDTSNYNCAKNICVQVDYDVIFTIASTSCRGRSNNNINCINSLRQGNQVLTNFGVTGSDGKDPFKQRPQIFVIKYTNS